MIFFLHVFIFLILALLVLHYIATNAFKIYLKH